MVLGATHVPECGEQVIVWIAASGWYGSRESWSGRWCMQVIAVSGRADGGDKTGGIVSYRKWTVWWASGEAVIVFEAKLIE